MEVSYTKTLLDLRIAEDIKGMPSGQILLVQGLDVNENPVSYAIFIGQDHLLGAFDAANEQQAVLIGLGRIRDLLALLSET